MKLTLDDISGEMIVEQEGVETRLNLYSKPAFELLSSAWVKLGWNLKYTYTFSWLGRPVIQLPEDLVRLQEVVYRLKPDVVIETGVAHGGSLVFFASLLQLIGKGRVIGVEVDLRPHNRREIESHELSGLIDLVDGDSVDPGVVERVAARVPSGASVLVFLDSCHTKDHVLAELESYHRLVTPGSYIVATDGVMREVATVPRGDREWTWNNPTEAAIDFARAHPEFVLERPPWVFSESELTEPVTHWPGAWLRRVD